MMSVGSGAIISCGQPTMASKWGGQSPADPRLHGPEFQAENITIYVVWASCAHGWNFYQICRFWHVNCTKVRLAPGPPSRYKGEGKEERGRKGLGIGRGGRERKGRTWRGREEWEGKGRDGSTRLGVVLVTPLSSDHTLPRLCTKFDEHAFSFTGPCSPTYLLLACM